METEKKFEWAERKSIPTTMIENVIIRQLNIKPFIKKVKLYEVDDEDGRPTTTLQRTKGGRIKYHSFGAFTLDCLIEAHVITPTPFNMTNDIVLVGSGFKFAVIKDDNGHITMRNIEGWSMAPFFINTSGQQPILPFARAFNG